MKKLCVIRDRTVWFLLSPEIKSIKMNESDKAAKLSKLKRYSTKQLKRLLEQANLQIPNERQEMLIALLEHNNDDLDNLDDEASDSDASSSTRTRIKNNFSFTDVESSIRKFSGDDYVQVIKWIDNFEEVSDLMEWSNLQKFVFAKRSLTGTALMVSQLGTSQNYESLKKMLIDEFDQSKSSAEIHALLAKSTVKTGENLLSFVIRMQEIASQAAVEEESVIQYVINGIRDRPENKVLLYGAKSLKELKTKLKIYESFKKNANENVDKQQNQNHQPKAEKFKIKPKDLPKCDHCGKYGHSIGECRQKSYVCYICKEVGHKAP